MEHDTPLFGFNKTYSNRFLLDLLNFPIKVSYDLKFPNGKDPGSVSKTLEKPMLFSHRNMYENVMRNSFFRLHICV